MYYLQSKLGGKPAEMTNGDLRDIEHALRFLADHLRTTGDKEGRVAALDMLHDEIRALRDAPKGWTIAETSV